MPKPDCNKHRTTKDVFGMSPQELAQKLGGLRYDSLADVMAEMGLKLALDSAADAQGGRAILSTHLAAAACAMNDAYEHCKKAWSICKPHMQTRT